MKHSAIATMKHSVPAITTMKHSAIATMKHSAQVGRFAKRFATTVVALAASGFATFAHAKGLLSAVRLPQEVIATPVLEGVLLNGLAIEMIELDIAIPVEIFLARLAPLLPEQVMLTISQGVSMAQWEDDGTSIALYAANTGDRRAVGALTAMRLSRTAPSFRTPDMRCGDPVARHLAGIGHSHPLFDLLDAGVSILPEAGPSRDGPPKPASPAASTSVDRPSIARTRGFVVDVGVDALVARLLYSMPREGWTTMNRHASSVPDRRVSLESACGRRRLKLDIAHIEGRTMAIAFESD